ALARAARDNSIHVESTWLHTRELQANGTAALAGYDALWCVPASPYASMEGALAAIRFARETGRPFLGTCGGFQHALIEYARTVLGFREADHAESNPEASLPLISPLACSLAKAKGAIQLRPNSRLARIYGRTEIAENYHCNFGLNPRFEPMLNDGKLN